MDIVKIFLDLRSQLTLPAWMAGIKTAFSTWFWKQKQC